MRYLLLSIVMSAVMMALCSYRRKPVEIFRLWTDGESHDLNIPFDSVSNVKHWTPGQDIDTMVVNFDLIVDKYVPGTHHAVKLMNIVDVFIKDSCIFLKVSGADYCYIEHIFNYGEWTKISFAIANNRVYALDSHAPNYFLPYTATRVHIPGYPIPGRIRNLRMLKYVNGGLKCTK